MSPPTGLHSWINHERPTAQTHLNVFFYGDFNTKILTRRKLKVKKNSVCVGVMFAVCWCVKFADNINAFVLREYWNRTVLHQPRHVYNIWRRKQLETGNSRGWPQTARPHLNNDTIYIYQTYASKLHTCADLWWRAQHLVPWQRRGFAGRLTRAVADSSPVVGAATHFSAGWHCNYCEWSP